MALLIRAPGPDLVAGPDGLCEACGEFVCVDWKLCRRILKGRKDFESGAMLVDWEGITYSNPR